MVGCDGKVLNITRMNSMRNHNWTIQAMILWNSGLFCGFLDDGLVPSRFEYCGTEVQGWKIWFQLDRVCKIKKGKERGIAEKWIFLARFIRNWTRWWEAWCECFNMTTMGFEYVIYYAFVLKAALCCEFCSRHWNVQIPWLVYLKLPLMQ